MSSSNIKKNRFQILSMLPANASQNVTGRFQISLLILKPKIEFYHNFLQRLTIVSRNLLF